MNSSKCGGNAWCKLECNCDCESYGKGQPRDLGSVLAGFDVHLTQPRVIEEGTSLEKMFP